MTRRIIGSFLILILVVLTSACNNKVKKTLGLRKTVPDEFRVIANAPLSVPPDFTLRPPRSGDKGQASAQPTTQQDTKSLIYDDGKSRESGNTNSTSGEAAFLDKAGTQNADQNIRETLESDNRLELDEEKKKKGFFGRVFKRKSKESSSNKVVDAGLERERILQNKKEGKPITEGETPTLDDSGSGEGILNKMLGL